MQDLVRQQRCLTMAPCSVVIGPQTAQSTRPAPTTPARPSSPKPVSLAPAAPDDFEVEPDAPALPALAPEEIVVLPVLVALPLLALLPLLWLPLEAADVGVDEAVACSFSSPAVIVAAA